MVFLFVVTHRFCCLHSRPPQGRGSVRGEPLTGSPTRVQSPARRRPLLRSKSAAPKKKDTHVGVFLFCDRPQVLLFALPHTARKGECEGETFAGFPTRVQSSARRRSLLRSKSAAPKKKRHTFVCLFFFGAGDEARTRYLDLGKVALYQMSYARKRKVDCSRKHVACQPCIFAFCKKRFRRGTGYRMRISTTPALAALG